MPQSTTYEKSCGIILINEGKLLILHYPSGYWDFPKGHVITGESEIQTARRELKEETQISDIELIEPFRETSQYQYRRNGTNYHKTVVYFLAISQTHNVMLSSEHQGYQWVAWEKAVDQLTFENSKRILRESEHILQSLCSTKQET